MLRTPWGRSRTRDPRHAVSPVRINPCGGKADADVKLINIDGMALIGPGSEWLWTAVSGLVLAVTFIAFYRQLRRQNAANAVARIVALQGEWTKTTSLPARLQTAIELRDGSFVTASAGSYDVLTFFEESLLPLLQMGASLRLIVTCGTGASVRTKPPLLRTRSIRRATRDPVAGTAAIQWRDRSVRASRGGFDRVGAGHAVIDRV